MPDEEGLFCVRALRDEKLRGVGNILNNSITSGFIQKITVKKYN